MSAATFLAPWCHALTTLILMIGPMESDRLDDTLAQLDRRGQEIRDLTADFREEKHTTLLKKPLVSTGRVFVKGARTRWDTIQPHESTLFTDDTQVSVHYPNRRTMEVFPVDRRLQALLVSPVPRVTTLREHFDVALLPGAEFVLRMVPKSEALADFVDDIKVKVDPERGWVDRIEITDPDGDRTVITFRNVRTNVGLTDESVARRVPEGTDIIYPLGGDHPPSSDADRTRHE